MFNTFDYSVRNYCVFAFVIDVINVSEYVDFKIHLIVTQDTT